jgi:hypothetical protein
MEEWYYLNIELRLGNFTNRYCLSRASLNLMSELEIKENLDTLYNLSSIEVLTNGTNMISWENLVLNITYLNGDSFNSQSMSREDFDYDSSISPVGDILYEMYNNLIQ